MLEVIRTHRRWMLFFVLILILPSFVFFGIQGYNQLVEGEEAVANIGKSRVTQAQLDTVHRQEMERLRQQLGSNFDPKLFDTEEAKAAVLSRLLNQSALAEEVKRSRVIFSDEQLAAFYRSTPQFLEDGAFSADKKAQIARQMGLTGAGLDDVMRAEQAALLLRRGVLTTAIVPHALRDRLLALTQEVREVRSLVFDPADYRAQTQVSEEVIKAHYEQHAKRFESPESLSVDYVVLSLDQLAAEVKVDEAQLRQRYEETHGANLQARQAVRAEAEDLLKAIKAKPGDFARLAKEHSQDPGSAQEGGLLPAFGKGEMVAPFEKAAFALKKGELAPNLVETEFGFHILKLEDIEQTPAGQRLVARHILLSAPEVKSFEALRPELERAQREALAQKNFLAASETFTNTAYEQPDSLEPLAQALGLEIMHAKDVVRGEAHGMLSEELVAALFADDALLKKHNTEAIEVQPGTLVTARVVAHQAAAARPLEQVRDQIKQSLQQEQAVKLAAKAAEQALAALSDPQQTQRALGQFKFSPARKISRFEAEGFTPDAIQAIMAKPADALPAYVSAPTSAGGVAVYAVLDSQRSVEKDAQQTAAIEQELLRQLGAADDVAYLAALRQLHDAKVFKKAYQPDAAGL